MKGVFLSLVASVLQNKHLQVLDFFTLYVFLLRSEAQNNTPGMLCPRCGGAGPLPPSFSILY